jgi:trigger factor
MNISQQVKENQTATVTIDVDPTDYLDVVEKEIKKVGKQAQFKGFRPGTVPKSVVQKMYGKSILLDELNKIVSRNLEKHLTDNNVAIVGNPLPIPVGDFDTDWSNPRNYSFSFEVGLAPEFQLQLPPAQAIPYYEITVDDAKLEEYIEDLRIRQGKFSSPEKADINSILYGEFEELDENGNAKEGGIKTKTTLAINVVKDETIKEQLLNAEKNSTIIINPAKAFQNNVEVGAMFNLKADAATALTSDFKLTVESINNREKADLNQELFDKVYGEGKVTTEEEFRTLVREDIVNMFKRESENKLRHDIEDVLLEELKITLPDEFLKRWLLTMNEEKLTKDQVDNEYPQFARGTKLSMIENKIMKEQGFKVTQEEINAMARDILYNQFSQYGLTQGMDDVMDGLVTKYLEKEENVNRAVQNLINFKSFQYLKDVVSRDIKPVTYEDFTKIVAEHHHHD